MNHDWWYDTWQGNKHVVPPNLSQSVDWYGNPVPDGSTLTYDVQTNTYTLKHPDGTTVTHTAEQAKAMNFNTIYGSAAQHFMAPAVDEYIVDHGKKTWDQVDGAEILKNIKTLKDNIHKTSANVSKAAKSLDALPKHSVVNYATCTITECYCSAGGDHEPGEEDFDGDYDEDTDGPYDPDPEDDSMMDTDFGPVIPTSKPQYEKRTLSWLQNADGTSNGRVKPVTVAPPMTNAEKAQALKKALGKSPILISDAYKFKLADYIKYMPPYGKVGF